MSFFEHDPLLDEAIDQSLTVPKLVRVTCPNPSCYGGDVIIPTDDGFKAMALCGMCSGRGYILTEEA